MASYLVLLLVLLSSALAYAAGRRRFGLPRGLRRPLERTLECIGLTVAFFALNVALGLGLTLLARLFGRFLSLYLTADMVLFILSAVQAIAFRWWWELGRGDKQNDATGSPRHRG